jgi:vacuolar iron transporter family protein
VADQGGALGPDGVRELLDGDLDHLAGMAGLVAGATSMAAGEYVSVSSQRDAEQADITREQQQLAADPEVEQAELSEVYLRRGLDQELAAAVAERLMAVDPRVVMSATSLGCSPAPWRGRCRQRSSRR